MDNELILINNIKNLIYTVRDKQVMLDSDVARLYGYETRVINQIVRRNIRKFPERFCFQLTEEEFKNLISQIATSSLESYDVEEKNLISQFVISSLEKDVNYLMSQIETSNSGVKQDCLRSQIVISNNNLNSKNNFHGGRRKLPYVFTEQGIAMLAPLLKNDIAIKVSINIMDAFVEMRKFINTNKNLFERITIIENKIDNRFNDYDKKIEQIFNALQKEENFKQKIFFEGQIYDAYSLVADIVKSAKEKIVIIDNYIDDTILKILTKKNKNVKVIILTSEKSNVSKLDIQKFNKQYPKLEIKKTNKFHDRFIVVDNLKIFHCGASIKDLGRKCFCINEIKNENFIEKIINV